MSYNSIFGPLFLIATWCMEILLYVHTRQLVHWQKFFLFALEWPFNRTCSGPRVAFIVFAYYFVALEDGCTSPSGHLHFFAHISLKPPLLKFWKMQNSNLKNSSKAERSTTWQLVFHTTQFVSRMSQTLSHSQSITYNIYGDTCGASVTTGCLSHWLCHQMPGTAWAQSSGSCDVATIEDVVGLLLTG